MENADKNSMKKIVRSLVGQYGKELYLPENELRFKGLLFDFASDFAKELKTLKIVLAERIPAKLLACDDKNDEEKSRTLQHCKDTLVDGVGLMEERVVQVLNVLTEGLGWKSKLREKQTEKSSKKVEKKEVSAENESEEKKKIDYDELVRESIGCFPRYDLAVGAKTSQSFYTSNCVFVGTLSSHIDSVEFSKCLRKLFGKYYIGSVRIDSERKREINLSLSNAKISKGEIWLVIVHYNGLKIAYCYTIVIYEIEKDFIDYEIIAGFLFDVSAYFDRKVLQNRLQIKDEGE